MFRIWFEKEAITKPLWVTVIVYPMIGTIALCLVLLAAFGFYAYLATGSAHAQTYQRLGDTIIGSDGSMAQPLGNGFIITQQPPPFAPPPELPPRQVFCQPLAGGMVTCN
jgi:hypothetical protein